MRLLPASILLLAGLCFTGFCFCLLSALEKGAAAYGGEYSEKTSRDFENLFLFIPPRRIAEIAWIAAAVSAFLSFLAIGGVSGSASAILVRACVAAAAGGLMLFAPSRLLVILRARRRARFELQLVGSLTEMGNALRFH